ncbi:hypothetical protein [Rhodohalobacter sulfatireducens]|uniref:ABC transporter permease n=1 Tax=Rhodohalobacter sulfatireducens TaxID=2911366 RepID=A0ABS9KF17_9BACT|nr:hypothetical protein [Rhodohalobacter sulfatireducens]MCG2589458.1 hypothetical protein [Rhodohalobacter sulfatireducens]
MNKIFKLAVTDFKLIFRDPSLYSFIFLPILLYGLMIWFLPGLVDRYDVLVPYLPLFLVLGVIENTQMFCFINSMVLIEEKETGVSILYGITPITENQFLLSRFIFPYLITVLFNVGLIALQPFYEIGLSTNIMISALAAMVVPVYVLGINSVVDNRMQGMIYIKAFNMIVLLPFAAFFVPENVVHLFGLLPTHWIFQSIVNVTEGTSYAFFAIITVFYFGGLMIWLSRLFVKKHFI